MKKVVRDYSYKKDKEKFLMPHFQVWKFRIFYENKNILTIDKILIDIKIGDKVKVLNNIQYNGEPFALYYDFYDVLEINNDRVIMVIGNVVTCAINMNNIVKV